MAGDSETCISAEVIDYETPRQRNASKHSGERGAKGVFTLMVSTHLPIFSTHLPTSWRKLGRPTAKTKWAKMDVEDDHDIGIRN